MLDKVILINFQITKSTRLFRVNIFSGFKISHILIKLLNSKQKEFNLIIKINFQKKKKKIFFYLIIILLKLIKFIRIL